MIESYLIMLENKYFCKLNVYFNINNSTTCINFMESGIYPALEKVFTGRTYKFPVKFNENILPYNDALEFNKIYKFLFRPEFIWN